MEKPRYLVIHIRLYRGKTNLVGLVGISIMHRDFSCQNGEGEKGKHRRETTLAPPLSRWRKGRWSRDDKSKRNAVDVWDASFDTRSNFLFPSLFHLDVTDPLIHRFHPDIDRPFPTLLSFIFLSLSLLIFLSTSSRWTHNFSSEFEREVIFIVVRCNAHFDTTFAIHMEEKEREPKIMGSLSIRRNGRVLLGMWYWFFFLIFV